MKTNFSIKTRDVIIILGILVAILIGISTQWAVAGETIFGFILH